MPKTAVKAKGKTASKRYTHIEVVMDRSGSMASIKTDTEGGFNTFVADQAKLPGKATITLTQFDDEIECVWKVEDVKRVKPYVLNPRGSTALYDAVGGAIAGLELRLGGLKKVEQPDKVVFLIVTDGNENASREYTGPKIAEMIEAHKAKGWDFVFLGANQDALVEAAKIGIAPGMSMTYSANAKGIQGAYASVSCNMSIMRSSNTADSLKNFCIDQRDSSFVK